MANRDALDPARLSSSGPEMADNAAKNWSGLVTLCLGQEREKVAD